MDITTLIAEHGPALGAALVALAGAAWALLKFIAPLTKSTKDDAFIADHGEAVEDALDKAEEAVK